MKIFSIAVGENGEIKIAGDLELAQAKQIIESVLIQQAFQQGIIGGQKEVKDTSKSQEGFRQENH